MPGKQNDVKITIVAKNGGSTVSPSEGNNDASNINANSGNVPPTDLGDVNVNSNVSLDNVASNSNSSKVKNAIGMITAAMVSTFAEQAKYQYNKYINLSENSISLSIFGEFNITLSLPINGEMPKLMSSFKGEIPTPKVAFALGHRTTLTFELDKSSKS